MQTLALFLAALSLCAPSRAQGTRPPPADPDLAEAQDPSLWKDELEFTPFTGERGDAFDWRLLAEAVARGAPQGANAVLSPVGVKLLLAMLYEGAAGATAQEIADVLALTGSRQDARQRFSAVIAALQESNPAYRLDVGLRMFLDESFAARTRYLKILNYFYDVKLQPVDFRRKHDAARTVNDWAQRATNGYIRDLVQADDLADVAMMLANAVFFEGRWLQPFSEDDTAVTRFYTTRDAHYNTPFMQQTGSFYYYNSSAVGAQIVRLPYKGGKFSMFVLLPHDMEGADALAGRLTPAVVRQLMWNMTRAADLRMLLPRFTFESRTDARALLRRLGVATLFGAGADLQGVSAPRNGPLYVGALVQKALVEVNEQGTRAAAATQASTVNRFGGGGPVFNARHPFLFFIEDEATATVLFAGKVARPGSPPPLPPPSATGAGAPATSALDERFAGDNDFSFDLSSRFGGDAERGDRRPPPAVFSTDTRRPEPTTRRPPPDTRFQQPFPQQPYPQQTFPQQTFPQAPRQQPAFAWTWQQPGALAGRSPAATFPYPASGQQQPRWGPNPQLVLIPVYAPIRRK